MELTLGEKIRLLRESRELNQAQLGLQVHMTQRRQFQPQHGTLLPGDTMELTLGEKIRLLRESRELNQAQLGLQVHMTQRKVSYLERDRYEPSVEDLKALCSFFQVSADYLKVSYLERDRYEPSVEDLKALCSFFQVSADYLLGFSHPLPFPKKHTDGRPGGF